MVRLVDNLSEAQMALQVVGGSVDRFQVLRYRGSEGLCRLYRFEIEVASPVSSVAFDEIVGRAAVLSVNTPGGRRWFHGIVSSFELTGETVDQTYYRIELSPSVWLLTHRYGSRTYQNQSVTDIVADVLTRAGIPADRFRFTLSREYAPREYCVQYRETDYNFIARLLEEEGIWWCFEQTREGHTLVMADSSAGYQAINGESVLPYAPPSGMNVPDEHVFRFRLGQSVRPGRVVLKDFNFQNPALDLKAAADSGRDAALEISDYPGEYAQQAQGTSLARLRAEEFESGRVLGIGQSSCGRLSPGRTFELIEHPSDALNAAYLVTSVTHQGKQAVTRTIRGHNGHAGPLNGRIRHSLLAARGEDNGALRELADEVLRLASAIGEGDSTAHRSAPSWLYHGGQVAHDPASVASASGGAALDRLAGPNLIDDPGGSSRPDIESPTYECRFECIPATVTFRPPRITAWPVMRGTQTARVVGPPGEEIYTDEYGRVKVQFNWDREGRFDERSSCWIRVSQGMAGGGYGMMFLPRVGQEVVVDFLEGNPDQPLIVGRVYNADHMPPYALPAEKTKSVIKTHSTTGGGGTNELCFDDQKDAEQILLHAQKDLHVRVKNDRVESVQRDHHLTVHGSKHELVKLHKTGEVKLDHSEKIGGKKSLAVTGDIGIETKANFSTKAKGAYYVHANSELVLESAKAITLKVGGNFIKIDAAGIVELGRMIKLNSGGSAGQGTAVVLKDATTPLAADSAKPGRDRRYSLQDAPADALTDASSLGVAAPPAEGLPKETSWIEIELVDESGQPVPGEAYEIINPDGQTIARGALDELGQAHVALREPGLCRISFPKIDAAAWARAGAPQTSGAEPVMPPPPAPGTQISGRPASPDAEADVESDVDVSNQSGAGPVGGGDHLVMQGECISSIAKDNGHLWETIWDHPANTELRAARADRNVLLPGDRVHVPALRKKHEPGESEIRHRFVRRGWPEMLRLRVLSDGEPRANEPYTLDVDGVEFAGTTDAEGKLSHPIVPNARRAALRIGVEPEISEHRFTLGGIDPIEEMSGVQGRLNNLGFDCGAIDGICGKRTEAALREYQRSRRLPMTGSADETTRKQLQADFGC